MFCFTDSCSRNYLLIDRPNKIISGPNLSPRPVFDT